MRTLTQWAATFLTVAVGAAGTVLLFGEATEYTAANVAARLAGAVAVCAAWQAWKHLRDNGGMPPVVERFTRLFADDEERSAA